jgi:hypothetical protein
MQRMQGRIELECSTIKSYRFLKVLAAGEQRSEICNNLCRLRIAVQVVPVKLLSFIDPSLYMGRPSFLEELVRFRCEQATETYKAKNSGNPTHR